MVSGMRSLPFDLMCEEYCCKTGHLKTSFQFDDLQSIASKICSRSYIGFEYVRLKSLWFPGRLLTLMPRTELTLLFHKRLEAFWHFRVHLPSLNSDLLSIPRTFKQNYTCMYWLIKVIVRFYFPLLNKFCIIQITLKLWWFAPSVNSLQISCSCVASFIMPSPLCACVFSVLFYFL